MPSKEIHEDLMETPTYNTMKKSTAEFKRGGGGESIEDDNRSGRPKDATTDDNVEVVHTLVMCDRRRDLQSVACEVGIRFGAVLTDILGMSRVSARWVPRIMTDDQKRTWLDNNLCLTMKIIPAMLSSEL